MKELYYIALGRLLSATMRIYIKLKNIYFWVVRREEKLLHIEI